MAKDKIPTEVESEVESELKTPADYLQAIRRTRILYNTKDALGERIKYEPNVDFGSIKNTDTVRSMLRDLSDEVKMISNNQIELEKLMDDYKTVSEYYVDSLSRSYSYDIHNYDEGKDEAKKVRIFNILDYIYASKDEKYNLKAMMSSDRAKEKFGEIDDICKKCNEYAVSILLLLTIKILPPFGKRTGDVKDIDSDFDKLSEFLEEYAKPLENASFLTFVKAYLNKWRKLYETNIAYGNRDSADSTFFDRLGLILYTRDYLSIANNENWTILQINKRIKYFFPELDGIWVESDQGSTDFWDIQEFKNGYNFYYYCYNSKTNVLTRTRYQAYFFDYSYEDCCVIFIEHPLVIKSIIQNKKIAEDLYEETLTKFEKVKTQSWDEENPRDITKISFEEECKKNRWFKVKNLYKVKEKQYYQDLIKKCDCINENEKDDYKYWSDIVVVTQDFLYFSLDYDIIKLMSIKNDGNRVISLRVPKSLDKVFDSITLGSNAGLLYVDGRVYLAVDECLFFKEITTKAMRKKLNIEITSIYEEFYNEETDSWQK